MNYMTLADVAQYLRLSRIMVYKMVQKGRIPAMKIGRVWRFSKEGIDRWMAEQEKGKENTVATIAKDFGDRLQATFGERFRRLILFGSYARGEASPESDVDLLVVLDEVSPADRRTVSKASYDETYGKDRPYHISTVVLSESDYLTAATPLLINIRREGKIAA